MRDFKKQIQRKKEEQSLMDSQIEKIQIQIKEEEKKFAYRYDVYSNQIQDHMI